MHALTLARQRIRDRIQNPSTPAQVRLAHGMMENGRTRYLPVLSSALAQDILTRGYDPRTLERIYANRADGELGPVGKVADRLVLNLPLHEALRERLEAATGEIAAAVALSVRAGAADFRLLSAPCGLANEVLGAARRLQARHPEALCVFRCWGVDSDADGSLLPEARRRAAAAGVRATFIHEDLRRLREVRGVVAAEGRFHFISCVGLLQRFSLTEARALVKFYAESLEPGGTLLIDRWNRTAPTRVAKGLGIEPPALSERELRSLLEDAGLALEREHPSGEGGCVLVVARKPA
ncbi:MAG: hypothetical protein ACK47B_08365 [Armatimonadota bacterium]